MTELCKQAINFIFILVVSLPKPTLSKNSKTYLQTVMEAFNSTMIPADDGKTIQKICPRFETRTPYLIVLISSTVSIWLSVLIFAFNFYRNKDILNKDENEHKYEPTSIELFVAGRTTIQATASGICYSDYFQ